MTWQLFIVYGITWAGAGGVHVATYPSEESCYRALSTMRVNDSPVAESAQKKTVIAYCKPKEPK